MGKKFKTVILADVSSLLWFWYYYFFLIGRTKRNEKH